ncbi:Bowman-Birk type proteinase inhibitor DE-4-like [Canna indica]|uniref:Bowman-Birk type proteinase inhibitor DE-4-like n=1 Tax=Canna indica TaxID=4628 RepID=A0AAQ3JY57_9LILI|nr:Bowman-Birk type proteinase inhibitor DE-4-like [Canna indica]
MTSCMVVDGFNLADATAEAAVVHGEGEEWEATAEQCHCHDLVQSCHPSCRNCVRSPLSVLPPMYQCMDRIPNFCHRRCSSEPLLGQ